VDEVDIAQEKSERLLAMQVAAARSRAQPHPVPHSHCRNCEAVLEPSRRPAGFCDVECRDDWQHRRANALRTFARSQGGED
jgi:predicted nucleic acid-binding Zn ribbon protein